MIDQDLLTRYLDGKLEEEDATRLMAWIRESPDHAKSLFEMKETAMSLGYDSSKKLPWIEQEWNSFLKRTHPDRKPSFPGWLRWALATLCLLLVSGLLLHRHMDVNRQEVPIVVRTSFGQQAESTLPDGSTVRLGPCTEISYSPHSWKKNRAISLNGEAAFDVTRNEKAPFIVRTRNVSVTVLGTSFDVSAYQEDEESSVILKEGSVRVSLGESIFTLKPGQSFCLNHNDGTYRIHSTEEEDLSWENNVFVFKDEPLEKMQSKLYRRFGYSFDIAPNCLDRSYRAHLEHESLSEFLNMLVAVTPNLQYTIDHETKTVRILFKEP